MTYQVAVTTEEFQVDAVHHHVQPECRVDIVSCTFHNLRGLGRRLGQLYRWHVNSCWHLRHYKSQVQSGMPGLPIAVRAGASLLG